MQGVYCNVSILLPSHHTSLPFLTIVWMIPCTSAMVAAQAPCQSPALTLMLTRRLAPETAAAAVQ